MSRNQRNPPSESVTMVDPRNLTQNELIAVLKEAVQKAGSSAKVAILLGTTARSVNRWLAGDGPPVKKMAILYVNIKNIDWAKAEQELAGIRSRSRVVQEG